MLLYSECLKVTCGDSGDGGGNSGGGNNNDGGD